MQAHAKEIVIKEGQMIRNKVSNEKVLLLAMNLGLLTPNKYEALKMIGESKEIDQLVKELSSVELDCLLDTLQNLLSERLIEIS